MALPANILKDAKKVSAGEGHALHRGCLAVPHWWATRPQGQRELLGLLSWQINNGVLAVACKIIKSLSLVCNFSFCRLLTVQNAVCIIYKGIITQTL